MKISVVIPTRNRPEQLRRILQNLQAQSFLPSEIIIVDSSDVNSFNESEFNGITVHYVRSVPSVCIQRNLGIKKAIYDWVFLCDDDLELPPDYLEKIVMHLKSYPEAGAVSGVVLQKFKGSWMGEYSVISMYDLIFRFVFKLSVWGKINIDKDNFLVRHIKQYYNRKGNHISKSGWAVITDFSGSYFKTPIYGLGASIIRKSWLLNSLYDEVLDPHGIGDNYGVALRFPSEGIHVINTAFVYHHEASENRLDSPILYYRRVLALDYFLKINKDVTDTKEVWLLWSLFGDVIRFLLLRKFNMAKVTLKLVMKIFLNRNPYIIAKGNEQKIVAPQL